MKCKAVDLHNHSLFGVDDGAVDLPKALEMLNLSINEGIEEIILTPHYRDPEHSASKQKVLDRIKELEDAIRHANIAIKIYAGHEIMYTNDSMELLQQGKILTLAGSRYVLTEFLPYAEYRYMKNALYEFLTEGYYPILAHIERYECLVREPELAEELYQMGVLLQVNSRAVLGEDGHAQKKFIKNLLKQQKIHFVATDAHSTGSRSPLIKKCAAKLYRHFPGEYIDNILNGNQKKVITNATIH